MTSAFQTSAAIGLLNADLRNLCHSEQVKQIERINAELLLGVEHGPSKLHAAADAMGEKQ